MPTEIRQFLERYRDAFNSLDGEAVAKLYAVPSGITHDGNYTHWPQFEPITSNMVALCNLYRERSYESAESVVGTFLQQGENYAIADLHWKINWSTGAEPWQFNTTYNLVLTSQGWRVLLCTAYSETSLHRQASKGAA